MQDYCDQGKLWDPTLSAYTVEYDAKTQVFTPYTAGTPTNWLYFVGLWGDQQYPSSDPRQKEVFGLSLTAQYTDGPSGPIDKFLDRADVCPPRGNRKCVVHSALIAGK